MIYFVGGTPCRNSKVWTRNAEMTKLSCYNAIMSLMSWMIKLFESIKTLVLLSIEIKISSRIPMLHPFSQGATTCNIGNDNFVILVGTNWFEGELGLAAEIIGHCAPLPPPPKKKCQCMKFRQNSGNIRAIFIYLFIVCFSKYLVRWNLQELTYHYPDTAWEHIISSARAKKVPRSPPPPPPPPPTAQQGFQVFSWRRFGQNGPQTEQVPYDYGWNKWTW